MTQQLIANMLGVTVEKMMEGAMLFEKAGLIRYSSGHIKVLDRPGLEELTCECYDVVKKEYDRLLPARGWYRRDGGCDGGVTPSGVKPLPWDCPHL